VTAALFHPAQREASKALAWARKDCKSPPGTLFISHQHGQSCILTCCERLSKGCKVIDELKALLISELNLEDITPDDIDASAPLFRDGLGLDSIDALELAVVLDKKYGIKIKSSDERNKKIFSSLNALTDFITDNRTR
jgi:acyl carrier protein